MKELRCSGTRVIGPVLDRCLAERGSRHKCAILKGTKSQEEEGAKGALRSEKWAECRAQKEGAEK